jgi:hypothetical protein
MTSIAATAAGSLLRISRIIWELREGSGGWTAVRFLLP